VHNLLLLNEFPDVDADSTAGRKTTPIVIGKRKSAIFYSVLTLVVYLWIVGAVATSVMPIYTLIGLVTLPLAIKAIRGSVQFDDPTKLIPTMATNVQVVILTQFLVAIGYIIARAIA